MITMREPGEWIRRRYPATVDKMGKGTLYLTSRRLVFESEKYGMCLDLHFKWLYEWYPTGKRKYRMSWFEPHPETNDVRVTDKTFSADIVLERRSDKWKPDSIELHYALCFAYTEWNDDDWMQEGFYVGADGKVRNHYNLAGPKQRTVDQFPGNDVFLGRMPASFGQHVEVAQGEMRKYFKGMTGERLIDQEFKWRYGRIKDVDEVVTAHMPLRPRRHGGRGGDVIPYEPDADRIKELIPDYDNSLSDDVIKEMVGFGNGSWQIVVGTSMANLRDMVEEEEKAGSYQESDVWKDRRRSINKAIILMNFIKKLYKRVSSMNLEARNQVGEIYAKAYAGFRRDVEYGDLRPRHDSFDPFEQISRLGLVDVMDLEPGWFDKIKARCKSRNDSTAPGHGDSSHPALEYEPVIGDIPEPKLKRRSEHYDMPKYRRLLVEAV